jgi:DNA adenine methylase
VKFKGEAKIQRPASLTATDETFVVRPPLKWAGGKRWLVPHLKPIWDSYDDRRLVEPLCGGLAVALGLRPERALLNDINVHAINFFLWLKKGLVITDPMSNNSKLFYAHRDRFNALTKGGKADSEEAAALFYYLNRTCYNGLCRFNRSGEFNVPFGRYKRINYVRDFSLYKKVFHNWEFTVGDFEDVLLEPRDFVYADPPYDVEFRQYSKEGFTWNDQVRLAKRLVKHSGPVVLSNQATPRIRTLYSELGFKLRFLEAPRMISCKSDRRKPTTEVMALRGI